MLALIQRVSRAQVDVEGETVGRIGPGLLALVCAEPGDGDARVVRMAEGLGMDSVLRIDPFIFSVRSCG